MDLWDVERNVNITHTIVQEKAQRIVCNLLDGKDGGHSRNYTFSNIFLDKMKKWNSFKVVKTREQSGDADADADAAATEDLARPLSLNLI